MNLYLGDCLERLKELEADSIDSVVTDPPYGLAFMGKHWDYDVPSVEIWKEVLRVLKPGGHLLSFGGTRTYHRMVINIEDAGFEIRDQIMWIYGSGFPKSMDISKAIDKQAGVERVRVKSNAQNTPIHNGNFVPGEAISNDPITDSAKQWQGWGTALKPANEPICLARKPISEKTVASNVLKHGTGAMNIDESRIEMKEGDSSSSLRPCRLRQDESLKKDAIFGSTNDSYKNNTQGSAQGRWPANVIFDEEAGKILDEQSGVLKSGGHKAGSIVNANHKNNAMAGKLSALTIDKEILPDTGGASRFFYCAKTSKAERNAGLEGMPLHDQYNEQKASPNRDIREQVKVQNFHPTVKPIKLMTYLIKLITPPNGVVLDPFMGSGSTGVAAKKEGFRFVGIERDEAYFDIASKRTEYQKCS